MNPSKVETGKIQPLYKDGITCAFIIITTALVYWQVGSHEFINFDDQLYVSDNPMVKAGISWEGIKWAFSFTGRSYWHPLTWLSHMLDCELFGTEPGMHHLMNMVLHIVNSLLLYAALRIMTGSYGSSSFAALLFALHPVNVDSVAWLAERKNLLSATFSIITILSYIYYSRKPGITRYLITLCTYLLGILAKPPTLVALPFVLLLLDYWPLRRITFDFQLKDIFSRLKAKEYQTLVLRLILEKIPLLIMSVAIVFISLKSSRHNVDVITPEMVGYSLRIENALISYVLYIGKMFWPANLTVYYPYPDSLPLANVVLAGMVLLSITAVSLLSMKNKPYLFTGWFWYLGTLVPVSGLLQVGLWPAMAERWVYVPAIGLFIMIAWGVSNLVPEFKYKKIALSAAGVSVLCVLMMLAWRQAGYWKNDFTLFSHALEVNDRNCIAYSNLGDYYVNGGDLAKAISYYQASLEINPHDPTAQNNLAIALLRAGRFEEAIVYIHKALLNFPDDAQLYRGLGIALAQQGKTDEAIKSFARALELDPGDADTHFEYAMILTKAMRIDDAMRQYEETLKIDPGHKQARGNLAALEMHYKKMNSSIEVIRRKISEDPHNPSWYYQLGALYSRQKKLDAAEENYKKALSLNGRYADALYGLSAVAGAKGDYDSAMRLSMKLIEIQPGNPNAYYNIACIYAKQNKVDEAIEWLGDAVSKGFNNWELMKTDHDLDNIRGSQGYKRLVSGR